MKKIDEIFLFHSSAEKFYFDVAKSLYKKYKLKYLSTRNWQVLGNFNHFPTLTLTIFPNLVMTLM